VSGNGRKQGARASAGRTIWGLLDQGLSSLVNFIVGFLVARSVSEIAFGAFSIAFAAYIVMLVASRALASEPFLIRHTHQPLRHWRVAVAGATGVALLLAAVAGAVFLVLGLVLGGLVGQALIPLAVVLSGMLLQDTLRFAFIARGRPVAAFLCDLAWILLLVPGLLSLHLLGDTTAGGAILVWGFSALLVATVGLAMSGIRPSVRAATGWWRRHRDIGPRYVAEGLMSLAASQTTVVVVGAIVGLAAAGGLRGAQLLVGPMQVLLIGLTIVAIPEGVDIFRSRGGRGLTIASIGVTFGLTGTAVAYALAVTLIPDELGVFLLGQTWEYARPVLSLVALAYAAVTIALGAGMGLRVLADARRSVRARAVDAVAQTVGGIGGAVMGGAPGAAAGLLVGALVGSSASWWQFLRAIRSARERDLPGASSTTDASLTAPAEGSHE